MRFRIYLEKTSKGSMLPLNYQYELSSAVYRLIRKSDESFSEFLHKQGYQSGRKAFRMFCFSGLFLNPFKIHKDYSRIEVLSDKVYFEFSTMASPVAENFIKGIFLDQHLSIGDKISTVDFQVISVEALSEPRFSEVVTYRALSPVSVSVTGKEHPQYLSPEDPKYGAMLYKNLLNKRHALQLAEEGDPVSSGGSFKLLSKPKSKLITLKPFTPQQTKVRGYLFEFSLAADIAMHEIGYYAGFGEKNSQGFGMVKVK